MPSGGHGNVVATRLFLCLAERCSGGDDIGAVAGLELYALQEVVTAASRLLCDAVESPGSHKLSLLFAGFGTWTLRNYTAALWHNVDVETDGGIRFPDDVSGAVCRS